MDTETWRELITEELDKQNERWIDIEAITLSDAELDKPFDSGFGGEEGKPFTAWTLKRVYFPICYDGSEWCGSVSRIIDNQPTDHLGGG